LELHPRFLVVAGKDKIILELGKNEAPVVVTRRIDQMPDDLLWRPFPGSAGECALCLRNGAQCAAALLDCSLKVSHELTHDYVPA
jgi:hypothetical protein